MNYTDVRNGDTITRTYENGIVIEFESVENPVVVISPVDPIQVLQDKIIKAQTEISQAQDVIDYLLMNTI